MWQRQISNERPLIFTIRLAGCPSFTALVVIAVGSKYKPQSQGCLILNHVFKGM